MRCLGWLLSPSHLVPCLINRTYYKQLAGQCHQEQRGANTADTEIVAVDTGPVDTVDILRVAVASVDTHAMASVDSMVPEPVSG